MFNEAREAGSVGQPFRAAAGLSPGEGATTGFDATEPRTRFIALFGVATLIALVVVILGVQAYVDRIREQEIFVKVLQPVSEDLKALRAREDAQLNAYGYVDRSKGIVRIPIDRAMDLLIQEAHAGANQ